MSESSPTLDRRTTKSRSVIFAAVRSRGQGPIAEALGISESTFSDWFGKYGDRVAQLLSAAGLKPVPLDSKCYAPEFIEHLRFFAERGVAQGDSSELEWGDE